MEEKEQPVYYSWQNPILRESIYPYRKKKLLEFILTFEEIERLTEAKAKGELDLDTIRKMQEMRELLVDEHRRISTDLQKALAARMERDKWLPKIKDTDEKKLRAKRIYYFDRLIVDWTDRLADRQGMKDSLLKRTLWYPEGDPRRQRWIDRAAELDKPIQEATTELDELKKIRGLYERQDKLPKFSAQGTMTVDMMVRWEMLNRRNELDKLSHSQLIWMIQDMFDADPEAKKYRPWLRYMAFHFSGMRYKSAHGSWADPKFLLAMLSRELLEDRVRGMSEQEITQACDQAIAHLEDIKTQTTNTKKIGELNRQISHLRFFNRPKALLAYMTDIELARVEAFTDQQVVDRLEELREVNPHLPGWFWQEIEKFTPLKLKTQDKDWETINPQRWDFEDRRWREILDIWERQDVTGWRANHRNTLDLIVTRAVCNEIAEHIQHLRGVVPGAGLTAKPRFYYGKSVKTRNLLEGDTQKAYFKYPRKAQDFKTGASILWMGIVTTKPNPWQVVESIPGFEFSTDLGGDGFLRWTHEATVVGVVDMLDGQYVLTFETGEIGLIRRHISTLVNNPNVLVGYVPEIPLSPDKEEKLEQMVKRQKILQME
jgi:hypothetical protein